MDSLTVADSRDGQGPTIVIRPGKAAALKGLLKRQIEGYLAEGGKVPSDLEPLLKVISDTYEGFGEERILTEKAFDLSSQELAKANRELQREVAERRRAEEAIRLSEEKYRGVVERATDGIAILQDGLIKYANPRAVDIIGYDPEAMLDTPMAGYILPDELPKVMDRYRRRMMGEDVESMYETGLLHKDGHRVTVELSAGLIVYEGRPADLVMIHDISERKRAEESLASYAAELARSNAELEQFAYIASHDLQEPLRMVRSYLRLLEKRYQGKLGPEADEFIYYAVDGAVRMQAFIEGLLSYSRVSTRGRPFDAVDCTAVLAQVLDDLQFVVEDSGAAVTCDPLPEVVGDRLQLGQLLQNLVGNALKFRGEEAPRIHVSAEAQAPIWIFSVHDNGIGIEPENADRVFAIFQRLNATDEYPGTGIGLAICKKIVERNGGNIWVESEAGHGATFFFTLPAQRGGIA